VTIFTIFLRACNVGYAFNFSVGQEEFGTFEDF